MLNTGQVYRAHFDVQLLEEDYKFMQSFLENLIQNSATSGDFEQMDKLLGKMFTNVENTYSFQAFLWKDYLYMKLITIEFALVLGGCLLFWFLYKVLQNNFNLRRAAICFFGLMYLVDFAFTWIFLWKEKELEQLVHTSYAVPPECNVKNMSYMQYFSYLFKGHDNCAKYHKIKDIAFFWSVPPSQVFGTQFGNFVLAPAEKLGNAFSKLLTGVFSVVPWYMMIPATLAIPLLLFCLLMAGCVLLSFMFGSPFGFHLFHLIGFSFGGNSNSVTEERKRNPRTINITLPAQQISAPSTSASDQPSPLLQLQGEKKTPIQQLNKQEIEEVPEAEDSSSGDEDIIVLQAESSMSIIKECDNEGEYELIS